MRKLVMVGLIGVFLLTSDGSTGEAQLACLHRDFETAVQRERREEALRSVWLINSAIANYGMFKKGYPSWEELAPTVGALRSDGGPMGRLARKMRWGTSELLPGWNIHHVAAANGYAFSLRDVRDLCGFSYFADNRGLIVEGEAIEPRARVIPAEGSD